MSRGRAALVATILVVAAIAAFLVLRRPSASPAPDTPALRVLRVSLPDNVKSLDPIQINDVLSLKVGAQIYEGLVDLDASGKLRPALAESWSTPDGKTWVFNLRKDATFSDSRPVTATVVKRSFERLLDRKNASVGAWIFDVVVGAADFTAGNAAEVQGFVARDEHTLEVTLREPYAPFVYRLLANYAWVVPDSAEGSGETGAASSSGSVPPPPLGTGPFRLESSKLDQELVLVRNGRHVPAVSGNVDRIVFRILKDPLMAYQEALRGGLDEYEVPIEQLPQVLDLATGRARGEAARLGLQQATGMSWYFLGFHHEKAPFGGPSEKATLLRQAVQLGIDKEAITSGVLFGGADALDRPFPPFVGLPNPGLVPMKYDPAKAAALLAKAGFPGGKGLPRLEIAVLNTDEAKAVATQIQADLGKLGLEVEYKQYDFPTLVGLVLQGKAAAVSLFIEALTPHPEYVCQFFLTGRPFNFFKYSNPEVDRLFEKSRQAATEDDRTALYGQLESQVMNDSPWIFLYTKKKLALTRPGIEGFAWDGLRRSRYEGVVLP